MSCCIPITTIVTTSSNPIQKEYSNKLYSFSFWKNYRAGWEPAKLLMPVRINSRMARVT